MRAAFAVGSLALVVALGARAAEPATAVVQLDGSRAYVRSDPALTLCGIALFVRAGLDRQAADQNGLAALVAQSVVRAPVDGMPLEDAVSARGGSLNYAISPQYVRFYLEGPASDIAALGSLVARALAAPSFDAGVLAGARDTLATRIAAEERDPRRVGLDMLRASHYTGGPGMPALGTPASLSTLGTADAQAFFGRWYVRGSSFVSIVGQTGTASEAASRSLVAALPAGTAPAANPIATRAFGAEPKRLVTRRDVYAPYVVIGFAAPALGDPDFAAALVVRTLLSEVMDRPSATTRPPLLRPGGIIYGYDTAPAQMAVWLNGGRIDATAGLSAIDGVLKRAADQPLAAALVGRLRERTRGTWALENVSLDDRVWEVGNAVALGLDADAAANVDDAIAHVTPADVRRVARRYFQHFDVALVLPRSGPGG